MSGPPPPEGTIDVEAGADRRLRRTWRVQRVGWGAMALVSIGALLGVFGDGPLAEASAGGGPGTARILYDRFARVDARQTIALEVPPELVTGSRLELRIDAGFAADYQLERATPAASDEAIVGDGVILGFRVDEVGVPLRVVLRVSAMSAGFHTVGVAIGRGSTTLFEQWVFP